MPSKALDPKKRASYLKTFNKLAWRILECKFLYYEGANYNLKAPPDIEYDMLEDKYNKLAKVLKLEPTASNMVGFDSSRGSCKVVMENMIKAKGKTSMKFKFKKKV